MSEKPEREDINMQLIDVLKAISPCTTIQIFTDRKEVFYGKIGEINLGSISPFRENKVYHIGIDINSGALTITC